MSIAALTIAGSDPSGGAGLQADLKTFHQFGAYGMSVVTLLTVQNTRKVDAVQTLEPQFVIAQLTAVLEDIAPHAAKTGALGNAAIIAAIARSARAFSFPLVVDPVMISKHGTPLIDRDAVELLRGELLPQAYLVTPNLSEAQTLSQMDVTDPSSMEQAAATIAGLGVKNVLVKGGHLHGDALDVLWTEGRAHRFSTPRIDTKHTHGTGCVYSAAITAGLAAGRDLLTAVQQAKDFVTRAIQTNPGLGSGYGPINLHARGPQS